MIKFDEAVERLLCAAEQDMGEPFRLRRDAMVEGRWVALEARFNVDGERKIMGLIPTGNPTQCQERCLFIPAETLDTNALTLFLRYIEAVHDAVVKPDAAHEFSMISLVLLTNGLDAGLVRTIKRYRYDRQYKKPQNGWSSIRLAVVDLQNGKTVCNAAGAPLRDRLLPTLKKQ